MAHVRGASVADEQELVGIAAVGIDAKLPNRTVWRETITGSRVYRSGDDYAAVLLPCRAETELPVSR